MLGIFKSKKADVLSHWYVPVSNFNLSTQDFYSLVEKELQEQKVPGLEITRVEYSEGGPLSDKRIYLRMIRERLIFDICAAPFGTNFFFSCRFAELPVNVSPVVLAFIAFISGCIFLLMARSFGFILTGFVAAALLAILTYIFRNLFSLGLADVDQTLLKSPFGPMYERFFRKESYYREDTRLMYLTVVEGIVKKLVEQETAANGIRLLTQYEHAPILGELYKPHTFGKPEEQLFSSRHVST